MACHSRTFNPKTKQLRNATQNLSLIAYHSSLNTSKMLTIRRCSSENADFQALVRLLDAELAISDGDQHGFYHQYNGISDIKYALVAYKNESPIGCGAIKDFSAAQMEVKRMYVLESHRGKGYASQILKALEQWTAELGRSHCILETGKKQPDAIRLYERNGYEIIENYGQYAGVENSVCFEKRVLHRGV